MKTVVVYKSSPEYVNQIVSILRDHGLDPQILDNPSSVALWTSKGTYRVRIAVPEIQQNEALNVIAKESATSSNRVKELSSAVNKDLLKGLVIYSCICFLFFLLGEEWELINFAWSFILTIIFLMVLNVIKERKGT